MKWEEVYNWYKKPSGEIVQVKKTITVDKSWIKLEGNGRGGYKDTPKFNSNKGEKINVGEGKSDKK